MNNKCLSCLCLSAVLLLSAGCADQQLTGLKVDVTPVRSPASVSSGEPNLCATPDGGAVLSWIERDSSNMSRLMFSRWENESWLGGKEIARGDDWFVNWADFPAVSVNAEGRLLASWLAKSAASVYAYDVKLAISSDGGLNWSDSFSPHSDSTPTEHGFVSMISLDNGSFAVAWLDGRQTVEEDGPMTMRFALIDSAGTIGENALLDSQVCDCCQTAMTQAGDGSIIVAYRDRSDQEIRDISVVRFAESKWADPSPVHNDGWLIEGCPVNGPAIAASDSLVALSWFTMGSDDSAKVLCAFSSDFGKTFNAPIQVNVGDPEGRVDLLFLDEKTVLVSWLENMGDTGRVAVRTVRPGGVVSEAVTVAESSSSRRSGFARMEQTSDGILIAWTEPTKPPSVKTALITVK